MVDQRNVCVRCGEELKGVFCYSCGEKKLEKQDKKLSHFFEELIASVFVADGKFLSTIKLLITRPGELTRNFVIGIRRKYLSPLQLFFFANLIYFIFPIISTFNTSLEVQMYQLPYSSQIERVVNTHLEKSGENKELFKTNYERVSNSNGKLLLIILVVLQGLFLKLLFFKREDLYLIDFFAGSAYFYGFYILFALVLFPALFNLGVGLFSFSIGGMMNEATLSIILLAVVIVYMYALIKGGYNTSKAGAIWRSLLLGVFLIPSFIIYRYVLFWVTFWMVA